MDSNLNDQDLDELHKFIFHTVNVNFVQYYYLDNIQNNLKFIFI